MSAWLPPKACDVDGCAKTARSKSAAYCEMHYGSRLLPDAPTFEFVGPNNHNWTGDQATYDAVHQRLKRARGAARQYPCVDCGDQALHWSWDRDGGVDDSPKPYGLDLNGFVPRCVKCHKRFDLACLGKAVS